MTWKFDSIVEIEKPNLNNTWQVRYLRIDDVTNEQETDYVKFVRATRPTKEDVIAVITKQINLRNNPPQPPDTIPDTAPELPGLTNAQQTGLNNVWPLLRAWIRAQIGRR